MRSLTTAERGYGIEHERLRRRIDAEVQLGGVVCSECGRPIAPGSSWHLAHNHIAGGYAGAAHAVCNLREKNRRQRRRSRPAPATHQSRAW